MTNSREELSWDEWDELQSPRPDENDFDQVVDAALSRRGFLGSVLAFGSGAAVMGAGALMPNVVEAATSSRFAFTPIDVATDATVHVPEGYSWNILTRWGDPLFSDAPEFDHSTGGDPKSDRIFGENTDGMELFTVGEHQLVAVNHEYLNPKLNLPQNEGGMPSSVADVLKMQNLQGVTVMEVTEGDSGWNVVVDSPFNRRIHHNTPMRIAGPAAGHDLLKTEADPYGVEVLGTMNNCGGGKTPWGTYLTCEENFNGYFGATNKAIELPNGFDRYGIGSDSRYEYEKFDPRYDLEKNPNEPNRFGYIVEIDPSDVTSKPVKRTALGRFKHENAEVVIASDGRVVVYLGDDERGEYLYKYVSEAAYQPGGDTEHLLNEGTLFVARFDADGTGQWIALTPDSTGMDMAEIYIHTRMAASAVGATTMDRPEWVAANPISVEAYCALTNNKNRGKKPNAGGDDTSTNAVNPREANHYGQIVRWKPADENHAATAFTWDLYVMAGNPTAHSDAYAGSSNINEGNLFNSPDGMVFDSSGLLWIQTDGNYKNEGDFAGMGNNQMLVGDPETGEIVRFMTVPYGAEVTGLCWSADRRSMFVGIQHPKAPFPDGEGKLARSSVVVVKRDDNAVIG
ncbi:transcriptional initiation protein Tat [Rhodobacterales bacterium 56_14_T64]|nr:transcriptional initiation protein Tat [Rhodobacterales bacterium 56_14_T64]